MMLAWPLRACWVITAVDPVSVVEPRGINIIKSLGILELGIFAWANIALDCSAVQVFNVVPGAKY